MGRRGQHGGRALSAGGWSPSHTRIALWYALVLGSLGALHPFLARSLAAEGVPAGRVAGVLALFPAGFLTAGLLWGWLTDRSGSPAGWLRLAAGMTALSAAVAAMAGATATLLLSLGALALFRAPMIPLVDALTLSALGGRRDDYGRVRLWGSVAFAAAVFGVGAWIDLEPRAPLLVNAGLLLAAAAVTFALPRVRFEAHLGGLGELRALLAAPGLRPLLIIAALQGAVHASYDFLFSLHMAQLGAPTWQATLAFVSGLTVEVTAMALAPRLIPRFGATGLVRFAVWLSIPRFALTGLALPTLALAALQALHGLTFGAFWLGAVALVAERSPPHLRNSGQAALMAASAGLGPLVMMLVAATGWFDQALGGVFLGAAAVAVLSAWGTRFIAGSAPRSAP